MPGVEQVQAEVNPLPNGSRQGSRQGSQTSINGHNNGNSSLSDLGERNMTGGSHSPTGSTRSRSSRESPLPAREKINKDLFVFPLEKKYVCTHCDDVLYYPVQLDECGHRFCKRCVYELRTPGDDKDSWRCGVCMSRIESDAWKDDKAFNNDILALTMKCKHFEWGCKWEGEFKNSQNHFETCDYSDIHCPHDCGAQFQKRFLQKHLDKDCPKMIISCPYCDERHLREDKKEHLTECPKLPLPCPNKCDKKLTLPRDELDEHIEKDCPRTKLMCQYECIGCAHRCSREKQPKHYKSELINHVKLIFDVMMKQRETLENHAVRLSGHDDALKAQDKRVGDLEKIAHSQLIWRIEDFNRKLKEAKAGNNDTLFSPTFTTSKHGYRLCASVCLNGDGKGKGTHMSVFISVLKGAFDALLKWPFDYRVTFYLLDQNDDMEKRKHIKFSIKPNACPENEPFLGRPRLEKNASFGGAKFAKHEEIEKGKCMYIKEDTIFLKITVDCDGLSEP